MTRRELLAMVPAAATVKTGRAAEVPFERIDTHNHIHRSAPALIATMEKTGWRGLSICDSREVGDQVSVLPEMIAGTAGFHRESQGRWAWATTFDARDFEKPGFADGRSADSSRASSGSHCSEDLEKHRYGHPFEVRRVSLAGSPGPAAHLRGYPKSRQDSDLSSCRAEWSMAASGCR
jgi:hypothetical protein